MENTDNHMEHATVDIDDALVTSMRHKLEASTSEPASKDQHSIYRVPKHIYETDEKAYEPKIISIGPYHHGKQCLQSMEDHKWRYLNAILSRNLDLSLENYIAAIKALESQARSCYSESIDHLESHELVQMMVVDGCFIVELFLKSKETMIEWKKAMDEGNFFFPDRKKEAEDPIYGTNWMLPLVAHDMLLLENQLPFFVLQSLLNLVNKSRTPSLLQLALDFFNHLSQGNNGIKTTAEDPRKVLDLLHLFHSSFLPVNKKSREFCSYYCYLLRLTFTDRSPASWNKRRPALPKSIPSATELKEAGVNFKQKKNMAHFTSYAILMNCLINTPNDVAILKHNKIIEHMLGSDEEAALLFNQLGKAVGVYFENCFFSCLFKDVNKYCETNWHVWTANLMRRYFNNPWTMMSLVAAILILTFTFTQTDLHLSLLGSIIGAFIDSSPIMAEGTRLRILDETITNHTDQLATITEQLAALVTTVTSFDGKLEQLRLNRPEPRTPDTQSTHTPNSRFLKLDFPRFDGIDPLGWIFKAEQFFGYHNTPSDQRLTISSFHMDGAALAWFQWCHRNHQFQTWDGFTRALETRFGPSQYVDHQGALSKLTQTTTVLAYITDFETLANRTDGLPPSFMLSCFISGLKPEIRREVQVSQPTHLAQAIGLAKLQAEKLNDIHRSSFRPIPSTPSPQPPPPTTSTSTRCPIRHLTPAEMQTRQEKGLCFNCDEKFSRNHRCKPQFHLMLADETDETIDMAYPNIEPGLVVPEDNLLLDTPAEISLNAFQGQPSPRTLRFTGNLHGEHVQILVDGGSTHNFIQERVAAHLKLPSHSHPPFSVTVGSGETLTCKGLCKDVPLKIGTTTFQTDLFILPLHGTDVVLGVQWLIPLGPVTFDYRHLSMSFKWNSTNVTLFGEQLPTVHSIQPSQLQRYFRTSAVASLYNIWPVPPQRTPPTTHPDLHPILTKYSSLFSPPHSLPPTRQCDHRIHLTPGSAPVNVRPYKYPYYQKREIELLVTEMLKDGIIQPSTSPFSSPVLLVKKKDGTWRFCVDYRALNAVTVKDRFPIPTVEELFDELHGSQYYSKLDLRSGFHQIRVHPASIPATAFRTHDGHYEFLVMPFGLTNAPSTFQAAMNTTFSQFLCKFVLVFFDDILIYSPTWEAHLDHLRQVLQLLYVNHFNLKLSKCCFGEQKIEYLGHIIASHGVAVDPTKIRAITQWPRPTTIKQLRSFLGLAGYYRRFVKNYASIAAPITDLLRKDSFHWCPAAESAFESLKSSLTTTPILQLPDFTETFIVDTDASGKAIGVVLSQQGHPIAFFSKTLSTRLQASSTYAREMFAITESVLRWRHYLLGHDFLIRTDHRPLQYLMTQALQTPEQQYWLQKLVGYNYKIIYKPGRENVVADALSRCTDSKLFAFTMPYTNIIHNIQKEIVNDPHTQTLLAELQATPATNPHYTLKNGVLYYKNRVYLPPTSSLKTVVFKELHSTPSGGHSGYTRTLARIRQSFYWQRMRKNIQFWVGECLICQQSKYSTRSPQGLLQPLPIPTRVWEDIAMDFITNLPTSNGKTTIFVVVDRLTKYAHFMELAPNYTAAKVADTFISNVAKLHGIPRSIVSDRDPLFLSSFWKELFHKQGTTLRMSSAYHPQTDGQTEVLNRCLEQYYEASAWIIHDNGQTTSLGRSIGTIPHNIQRLV
ncbi:uncharacterized protein LOC143853291 [Tasmannia lanceolata]|uniref:uncharacterized protein LOC143853291 n=1 Tax=Tasmannia lanceolata TaxID=3420 RepID=UPI004063E51B